MDKSIEIDDALIKAAQHATGEIDEKTAVERVLRETLVTDRTHKSMFDLVGHISIREDYDYKATRVGNGPSG
jgi:hypothetical protein